MAQATKTGIPIFCPNGETVDEIEGILSAAAHFRHQNNLPVITLGIGITGTYPDHPQLQRLALDSDLKSDGNSFTKKAESITEQAFLWLDWLALYADRGSLFPGVEIIPFLDHGWVPSSADLELMQNVEFQRRMGIIMFDGSYFPLEENIARTSEYVQRASANVVVEASPDKILSAAELAKKKVHGNLLSNPEEVEKFVRATGVNLIVPSLGTEHRGLPGEDIYYRRELAQDLSRRVGPMQALHGTSSLGDKIRHVGQDGIVKVNFYTGMARAASEAVRSSWKTNAETLKIEQASGSFLHNIRRQKIREECLRMLQLLQPSSPSCCTTP